MTDKPYSGCGFPIAARVKLDFQNDPRCEVFNEYYPAKNGVGLQILGRLLDLEFEAEGLKATNCLLFGELNNFILVFFVEDRDAGLLFLKKQMIQLVHVPAFVKVGYLCLHELIWRSYFPRGIEFEQIDTSALPKHPAQIFHSRLLQMVKENKGGKL
ncbi:MAG: hypothetical protein ABI042_10570 [Verrucomicrobiota bacterium]